MLKHWLGRSSAFIASNVADSYFREFSYSSANKVKFHPQYLSVILSKVQQADSAKGTLL
jgi:hypothetical protein